MRAAKRMARTATGIAAALLAVVLAAAPALAQEVKVTLSGAQEIPPVTTSGAGTGTVSVAPDGTITARAVVTGVKVTVAHIHDAPAGTNGPIVIPLVLAPDGAWVVAPGTKLTPAQLERYKAGNLYFNIHSDAYKAGEIRGQIKP